MQPRTFHFRKLRASWLHCGCSVPSYHLRTDEGVKGVVCSDSVAHLQSDLEDGTYRWMLSKRACSRSPQTGHVELVRPHPSSKERSCWDALMSSVTW